MSKPATRDKTRPNLIDAFKPIPIAKYIAHLEAGGAYTPSKQAIEGGADAMSIESVDRAAAARRLAKKLRIKRSGNSKYNADGRLRK